MKGIVYDYLIIYFKFRKQSIAYKIKITATNHCVELLEIVYVKYLMEYVLNGCLQMGRLK